MKFFKKAPPEKSWGLILQSYLEEKRLVAVDMSSGSFIGALLFFRETGEIERAVNAFETLEKYGYDPHEHDNKFDEEGRWIID